MTSVELTTRQSERCRELCASAVGRTLRVKTRDGFVHTGTILSAEPERWGTRHLIFKVVLETGAVKTRMTVHVDHLPRS